MIEKIVRKSIFRRFSELCYKTVLFTGAVISAFSLSLPGSIAVYSESELSERLASPIISYSDRDEAVACIGGQQDAAAVNEAMLGTHSKLEARLFGIIPIGEIDVGVYRDVKVTPGGMSFGVRLAMDGVLIVGMSDIEVSGEKVNPAYAAGLRTGDLITSVSGSRVSSVSDVTEALANCNGEAIAVRVNRDGGELEFKIEPKDDGSGYKAGIWIRDSTAGIGTVTYIIPESGAFAGLGHGIYDSDSGKLVPMLRGTVNDVIISGIKKGRSGAPGELQGYFGTEKLGSLISNSECGVFGVYSKLPTEAEGAPTLPIGLRSDVKEGGAKILCTLDSTGISEYSIKITQISDDEKSFKNFIIEVNDPVLLEKTGGIVQGMSGSPVIQDGRLIGAVTHVMIGEPTRGYGIFIENMLMGSGELLDARD